MRRREPGEVSRLGCSAIAAAAASVPMGATAQERMYEWGWGMHPMWGVWGAGMLVMMLVFWGVVIVALVLGIRWIVSQGRPPRSDMALAILRERYARGEIDKQEFEAKKRDLG
jgi:putative membrane protein